MKLTAPSVSSPATLTPIPALSDNYIWVVQKNNHALIIDPGEAAPVEAFLDNTALTLEAILITHHHGDHTAGVQALKARTGATVYGPHQERLAVCDQRVGEQDTLFFPGSGLTLHVLDVPGHTAGHIAYAGLLEPEKPVVFCGDTLFAAGCGRLFEGTPAQMLASLDKIAALPGPTLVCCAHEYTLANLRWALQVEPGNAALAARMEAAQALRDQGLPTLPTRLALERQTNPFLRVREPEVAAAASAYSQAPLDGPVEVFAALRAWKNQFKS